MCLFDQEALTPTISFRDMKKQALDLAAEWIRANLSAGALEGLEMAHADELTMSRALEEIAAELAARSGRRRW